MVKKVVLVFWGLYMIILPSAIDGCFDLMNKSNTLQNWLGCAILVSIAAQTGWAASSTFKTIQRKEIK